MSRLSGLSGLSGLMKNALLLFGPVPLFTGVMVGLHALIGLWGVAVGFLVCFVWAWFAQGFAFSRGW